MQKDTKFNIIYHIFRIVITIFGCFLGAIIALTLFYPLILAFPSNFIVVFIELYLIIYFAMYFGGIFSKCFSNYVNYKPLFFEMKLKDVINKNRIILSFYIFGFLFFFLFIKSLF